LLKQTRPPLAIMQSTQHTPTCRDRLAPKGTDRSIATYLRSSEDRKTMPGFIRAGMFAPTSRRFRHAS